MIQKLQKIFHTDKWWGKLILLLLFYIIYFIVGYWIWFLIMNDKIFNYDIFIAGELFPSIYFFLILPLLSFVFVFQIRKAFNFKINRFILFVVNLILILLNLFLFLFVGIRFFIKPDIFI